MTDTLELHFDFEEMNIPICGRYATGIMLYGTARLSGDEDGFSVVAIRLDGGTWLRRRGNGQLGFPAPFEDELFHRIADQIENPKTTIGKRASNEWADVVEDAREVA